MTEQTQMNGHGVFWEDCRLTERMLDTCEIEIDPENRFFVSVSVTKELCEAKSMRKRRYRQILEDAEYLRAAHAGAYTGCYDFGHTSAEWSSVISLGIFGLRARVADYAERYRDDADRTHFYGALLGVLDAALRFMARCAELARHRGMSEMADGLTALTDRAPESLFEAMQTALVYYNLQQHFDRTILRTMGRLDSLLYPYFKRTSRADAERLLLDFFRAMNSIHATANLPFAIGGTDARGESLVNEMTDLILDTYRKAGTTDVKLHLLCSDNMPRDLIRRALDAVREGNNSIVFLSDRRVIESLEKLGEEHSDAADYHVVGCYECGGNGELTCSCNARVNIPKALEYALNNGVDMLTGERIGLPVERELDSYDALYAEFGRQLAHLCRSAMQVTDRWEAAYPHLHAAPILSATYTSALEAGGDVYCDQAAKYCNSSLNALGLATATDSLYTIRRLVFEEHTLSLPALTELLRADWEGQEPLRLRCQKRFPKYGMGNADVDAIAQLIVADLASTVSGAPNQKGGVYRLGLFSIDWRWEFGAHTAASADGRRCGEPISQNASATFGGDREGATAHLLSVASLDSSHTPNGTVADVDFHSSAVRGENGLEAMYAALRAYFDLGGFAVHFNVLDRGVLIEARNDPAKYPTLQVRLCGWNVLFSSLTDREKDEFILRFAEE